MVRLDAILLLKYQCIAFLFIVVAICNNIVFITLSIYWKNPQKLSFFSFFKLVKNMESDLSPEFTFFSCNTFTPASQSTKPGNNSTVHHTSYEFWSYRIITKEDNGACRSGIDLLNIDRQKFIAAIWNFHLFYSQNGNVPLWQNIRTFENKCTPPLRANLHHSVNIRKKMLMNIIG